MQKSTKGILAASAAVAWRVSRAGYREYEIRSPDNVSGLIAGAPVEFHGVEVVVDKRSLLYLGGAVVDFHDDLNKRGVTVTNPSAKGTCGCGSSYSM